MPSPPPSGFVQRTTADEFSLRPRDRSLAPRRFAVHECREKRLKNRGLKKNPRNPRFQVRSLAIWGDANVRNISPFTISSVPPQVVRAACTTRDDMAIDRMVGEMTAEEALLAVLSGACFVGARLPYHLVIKNTEGTFL
jgi:hypothetical protein